MIIQPESTSKVTALLEMILRQQASPSTANKKYSSLMSTHESKPRSMIMNPKLEQAWSQR
ncbi:hypothetical protein EV13_0792 [Prochlorococcus sp. MIT 0702]|nr:hypothetical protein EV13_0792 [Prochlorococcus sp. MIT 0702]